MNERKVEFGDYTIAYPTLAIFILSVLYLVGIVGLVSSIFPWFVYLTPVNLLVSLLTMYAFHQGAGKQLIRFSIPVFTLGFLAEVIGVNTGLIFGHYNYGDVLGLQLFETPLMIGVNWLLLVYASGVTINHFFPRKNKIVKATLAAGIMVLLDICIEPVAIRLNFWTWASQNVPLQNYFGWFLIAWPLTYWFQYCFQHLTNKVGLALFMLQFVFFVLLNLLQ